MSAKPYEPELGQFVWGQPTSEFSCPDFIEAGLRMLADEIERVEWNLRQEQYEAPTSNNGGEYQTEAFEMYAYYWGDCTCGAECPQHSDECQRINQDAFNKWNDARWQACGFPASDDLLELGDTDEFDAAHPRPEWTCTCGAENGWAGREHHEPTCLSVRPNFKCGDFEVRWYKYLGRGMSMNQDIDANRFFELIDKCLESVRAKDRSDAE